MIEMSLGQIAEVLAAECPAGMAECVVGGVSTDSRQVKAGDVFFAIPGEKFDGHDFVAKAILAGAAAAVVAPQVRAGSRRRCNSRREPRARRMRNGPGCSNRSKLDEADSLETGGIAFETLLPPMGRGILVRTLRVEILGHEHTGANLKGRLTAR